ncbi:MAG: nicotinate phosphoribosyltransferase [Holophagae bacterium]|nr:MAG: nicotinate phosphoribosyltransferase [Holophagae bacterium]
MMQAYWANAIEGSATFDLFVRRLPPERNFLLAVGLETALDLLEGLRFTPGDLEYLSGTGLFDRGFLDVLAGLQFTGDVDAMAEGTVAFAREPMLRVTAPILEAQFFESLLMNQYHVQTLLASKAARVVLAAGGRRVVDFGMRRMHGVDSAVAGARAYWIAGLEGTSNVLAGQLYGIPIVGTMAHSFVQCHSSELDAFRAFTTTYPETVLLVDTYDSLHGVEHVIELARELGAGFRVRGIRLDSGNLAELSRAARQRLDAAGLGEVRIFVSGNLDEHRVAELVRAAAPIDAFGVGTRLGTSEDAPNLDLVYKLAQLGGRPLLKLSTDKATLPGVKQVWRTIDGHGRFAGDVISLADEGLDGVPLLAPRMRRGKRVAEAAEELVFIRRRAADQLAALPDGICGLAPADPPYPVEVSAALAECTRRVAQERAG